MSNLINNLVTKIATCLTTDQKPLRRLLANIEQSLKQDKAVNRLQEDFDRLVTRSVASVEARIKSLPKVSYDSDLPVVGERENIISAIHEHQVIIVAGETGSGKTTQLPKICIDLKRGSRGIIGHTQPRRIAARSVATRIASELGTDVGQGVGYQVRFQDRCGKNTYLKLMTDGILLAQIQHDHYLYQYDTLIIDEAQKIPDIGQALKILVDQVPKLKVIVTGSSSFDLAGQIGEPLTGRKLTLTLYPVAHLELNNLFNTYELREQQIGRAHV